MPPLADDISSDDGPDEVPAKSTPPQASKDGEESNDEEEGSDGDEDEYKVEAIVAHRWDKPRRRYVYHIKWEGYADEADMTWEPLENLENAQALLKAYHKSVGGTPEPPDNAKSKKGAPKTKKRSADSVSDSPLVKASAKKRQRMSPDTDGTSKKRSFPPGSWEDDILRVSCICEDLDKKSAVNGKSDGAFQSALCVFLEWTDGAKTQHAMSTIRVKAPQKLLDYYEGHLKGEEFV